MPDVTQILSAIQAGDPRAAEQLLPLVYDELRKLAAAKLAAEKPGQTLQATALVHEAYLRLVGPDPAPWSSRGHFFAAAAEVRVTGLTWGPSVPNEPGRSSTTSATRCPRTTAGSRGGVPAAPAWLSGFGPLRLLAVLGAR